MLLRKSPFPPSGLQDAQSCSLTGGGSTAAVFMKAAAIRENEREEQMSASGSYAAS